MKMNYKPIMTDKGQNCKLMQNLIHEFELKWTEQDIWDTCTQYNNMYLFPNAIEHDKFDEQKYAYKASVKRVRDEDKPCLAAAAKISNCFQLKEAKGWNSLRLL